jgi:putative Holliday junction resolvase
MLNNLIGIDFGRSRIGIASGQMITKTATPIGIIQAKDGIPRWQELDTICEERKPNRIIVGLSVDAQGEETDMTKSTRRFAEIIRSRYQKPTSLISEAFSTREARWRLEEIKGRVSKKLKVDAFAACVILETWMSSVQID